MSALGSSLATGDFNGDGYSDLLAGAPGIDRVDVFMGGDDAGAEPNDAGADVRPRTDYQVGCSCSSTDGVTLVAALLAMTARSRRRARRNERR